MIIVGVAVFSIGGGACGSLLKSTNEMLATTSNIVMAKNCIMVPYLSLHCIPSIGCDTF